MDSNMKGRALEDAVHAIETVILATVPGLQEDSFTIETRRRITVGGVLHKIDIWVETAVAKGYSSIFIFECKNQRRAVGKNDIAVFSEKVDAVRATHGYFVAKSFTKHAKAQAKKDPRMTLLLATEHDPVASIAPDHFHFTEPAPDPSKQPSFTFRVAGTAGTNLKPLSVSGKTFLLHGVEQPLRPHLDALVEETYAAEFVGMR